jgi:CRISPR-associated endoribonuclease Cas6
MPLKVFINLELSEEIDLSELKPDGAHGIFFSVLGEESAKILHEDFKNVKPFSLFCRELFQTQPSKVLHLELNILKEELAPTILRDLILENGKNKLFFKGKTLNFRKTVKSSGKFIKSYESFLDANGFPAKVEVKFVKPATFRRENLDFPFPLPELVFKTLLKRWIFLSGIKPELDLRRFYNLVEVSKYDLKTRKVEFANGGKLTAFEGRVEYNFGKVKDSEAVKWFYTLLKFSEWSGVGRKTTMGLGKVKILQKD